MNLVFMNSLEKKVGDDRVITAQVSIGEHQGKWHLLWSEPGKGGKQEQHNWYEGIYWEEMLDTFRERIMQKTGEGYEPLLKNLYSAPQFPSEKIKFTQMLYYYSQLNGSEEVFEQLRKWRKDQSSKEGKAPYILASNRILKLISAFLPRTKEELLQIPGFGENKVTIYGGDLLAITNAVPQATPSPFPLDWVVKEIDETQFNAWVHQQQELKLKSELDKKAAKRKLLEGISQGNNLSQLQEELNVPRRDMIQWIEELDNEGYDVAPWAETELLHVPEEERTAAWKGFEEEGTRYLKPVLKRTYNETDLKNQDLDYAYEWLRLLRLCFRKHKAASAKQASA